MKNFPSLIKDVSNGPVCCMVWEGDNTVLTAQKMIGAKPLDANPGTIRGDYSLDAERSIVQSSDSVESATKDIDLWFTKEEQLTWTDHSSKWIYE